MAGAAEATGIDPVVDGSSTTNGCEASGGHEPSVLERAWRASSGSPRSRSGPGGAQPGYDYSSECSSGKP